MPTNSHIALHILSTYRMLRGIFSSSHGEPGRQLPFYRGKTETQGWEKTAHGTEQLVHSRVGFEPRNVDGPVWPLTASQRPQLPSPRNLLGHGPWLCEGPSLGTC